MGPTPLVPESGALPIVLLRIDERLLHGQVIVGWGMRLRLAWYVVADDALAGSAWEHELYAAGLPAETEVLFLNVADAIERFDELDARPAPGALLTRGTEAMRSLAEVGLLRGREVNLGGLHAGRDRREALDYLFLRDSEAEDLRRMEAEGATIAARDLPDARRVPLADLLASSASRDG